MLSDTDIRRALYRGEIRITPHNDQVCVGPASYDVHLYRGILVPLNEGEDIDISIQEPPMKYGELPSYDDENHYYLRPGERILGSTLQEIELRSRSIACDIAGNSSLGRVFVMVHVTAGFVDPGWGKANNKRLTVELKNVGPWGIRLWEGMRIAQLRFYRTESSVTRMYDERKASHYTMGPDGPQASRYYLGAPTYEQ